MSTATQSWRARRTRASSVAFVHPIESLRRIARSGDVDPVWLAQEAAEALGSLSYEAQALVPACRRLIEAHPSCGPLWWVASRIIVADDPYAAAYTAIEALADDPTSEELAASLPSEASVVIPARADLAAAMRLRPDISITVVGTPYRLNEILRRFRGDSDVIGVDQRDFDLAGSEALTGENHLVILEALAAGPDGVIVDQDQAALVTLAAMSLVPCWVMTGVGRTLPAELLAEIRSRTVEASTDESPVLDDDYLDLLEMPGSHRSRRLERPTAFLGREQISVVVGPRGKALPELALRRAECKAPAELLGFARQR